MSRAYKRKLIDNAVDLGMTGVVTIDTAGGEAMSGADLAQVALALENGASAAVTNAGSDVGKKVLGNNLKASTLAVVTADGVNTVTVDSVEALAVGQKIEIRSASGGTIRATNRSITAIAGLVVTYNGADASAAVVATDLVVSYNPLPGQTGIYNSAALSGGDQELTAGLQ